MQLRYQTTFTWKHQPRTSMPRTNVLDPEGNPYRLEKLEIKNNPGFQEMEIFCLFCDDKCGQIWELRIELQRIFFESLTDFPGIWLEPGGLFNYSVELGNKEFCESALKAAGMIFQYIGILPKGDKTKISLFELSHECQIFFKGNWQPYAEFLRL